MAVDALRNCWKKSGEQMTRDGNPRVLPGQANVSTGAPAQTDQASQGHWRLAWGKLDADVF